MNRKFEIRPLTGSKSASVYRDTTKPLYDVTLDGGDGFKTHELRVGDNQSWNSELKGNVFLRIEDDGDNLHIYFGRGVQEGGDGKAIDLNSSEAAELRIMLNLMHRNFPNMFEKYESVERIEKVEEV